MEDTHQPTSLTARPGLVLVILVPLDCDLKSTMLIYIIPGIDIDTWYIKNPFVIRHTPVRRVSLPDPYGLSNE